MDKADADLARHQRGWRGGWNEMSGPTFNWPQDGHCCCPCLRVTYVHGIREAPAGAMGGLNLRRKLLIKYVVHPLCPPSRLQGVDGVDCQSGQAPASVEGGLRSLKGMQMVQRSARTSRKHRRRLGRTEHRASWDRAAHTCAGQWAGVIESSVPVHTT